MKSIKEWYRAKHFLYKPLSEIDRMRREEFSEYLAEYFRLCGYKVSMTPEKNNFGADLILQLKNRKTVVQTKRYVEKVDTHAVRYIIGAKGYYDANDMMIITSNYFTDEAIKLADEYEVKLWDRDNLIQHLNERRCS